MWTEPEAHVDHSFHSFRVTDRHFIRHIWGNVPVLIQRSFLHFAETLFIAQWDQICKRNPNFRSWRFFPFVSLPCVETSFGIFWALAKLRCGFPVEVKCISRSLNSASSQLRRSCWYFQWQFVCYFLFPPSPAICPWARVSCTVGFLFLLQHNQNGWFCYSSHPPYGSGLNRFLSVLKL